MVFDPFAVDADREFLACRLLGVGAGQEAAAAKSNTGGSAEVLF